MCGPQLLETIMIVGPIGFDSRTTRFDGRTIGSVILGHGHLAMKSTEHGWFCKACVHSLNLTLNS